MYNLKRIFGIQAKYFSRKIVLDPTKRYLFSEPHGGFNDALVQLEKVRRYASQYDRTLILDLEKSGIRLPFKTMFVAGDNFGCELMHWNNGFGIAMDKIETVIPLELTGKVSTSKVIWNQELKKNTLKNTTIPADFDLDVDHEAQLLVHKKCGGGLISADLLGRVSLQPWLADKIAARLIPLGPDYDAIHVRHSDYKTDYVKLFEESKNDFIDRPLLICSDSKLVKDTAEKMFHPSTRILSVANIPDTKGRPIHQSNKLDPIDSIVDLLSDLLALSRSNRLLYSKLLQTKSQVQVSGFSRLAETLKSKPETVRNLFRNASDADYAALFLNNASVSEK